MHHFMEQASSMTDFDLISLNCSFWLALIAVVRYVYVGVFLESAISCFIRYRIQLTRQWCEWQNLCLDVPTNVEKASFWLKTTGLHQV